MRIISQSKGLTLIEVLIALAIISIAMTAVIKATSQNIRATSYLQTKMMAMWVGQQVLNEARAHAIKLPTPPDKLKDTTDLLGKTWYWHAGIEATPNSHIKKLTIAVFVDEDEEKPSIINLENYIYHDE